MSLLRFGQARQVRVRELVVNLQATVVHRNRIKNEIRGIEEAGKQRAVAAHDSERFPPHWTNVGHEDIRAWMDNEIKRLAGKPHAASFERHFNSAFRITKFR